jgi:hypothetical protein
MSAIPAGHASLDHSHGILPTTWASGSTRALANRNGFSLRVGFQPHAFTSDKPSINHMPFNHAAYCCQNRGNVFATNPCTAARVENGFQFLNYEGHVTPTSEHR